MVDDCVHHWVLGPPSAEGVSGTCKRCLETRVFGGGDKGQYALSVSRTRGGATTRKRGRPAKPVAPGT